MRPLETLVPKEIILKRENNKTGLEIILPYYGVSSFRPFHMYNSHTLNLGQRA